MCLISTEQARDIRSADCFCGVARHLELQHPAWQLSCVHCVLRLAVYALVIDAHVCPLQCPLAVGHMAVRLGRPGMASVRHSRCMQALLLQIRSGAHAGRHCWRCKRCTYVFYTEQNAEYHTQHGCMDKRRRERPGSVSGMLSLPFTSFCKFCPACAHKCCAPCNWNYTHDTNTTYRRS